MTSFFFNSEFQLELRPIDIFSSHFSLYKVNCYSNKSKIAYYNKLDELIFNISLEPNIVIVVSDASIKNNITISIAHIYSFNNFLKKILLYY